MSTRGAYDAAFYNYIHGSSLRSAREVCTLLNNIVRPSSVLDVGCGDGSWLSAWARLGVDDYLGLDGEYARDLLLSSKDRFRALDLCAPFDLGRRFDLVESLEVAEHLAASASDAFVASLVRHAHVVLFSAAPPGQFGNTHVNEQEYEYWRRKFEAHDYDCHDVIRPAFARTRAVAPWYRYNAFVYVRRGTPVALNEALQATRVPTNKRLSDTAPLSWRARRVLFRTLPPCAGTFIARGAATVANQLARGRGAIFGRGAR